ncbi:tc5 transposase DNA-binding domain-containing protein [Ditylenchus destructor]|nr:tc5 transposase DNA-binding domain-containing protein [Ditylenchus destructor]
MELLPPKPAKRKRLALSDAAKSAICAYKRDHPSAKPEDVATEIQRRFQLDEAPARRTIYDVLKESEKWLSIEDPSEKTLSHKPVQHPQLEEALFMWIKDKEAHGLPLSDYLVAEQAKSFGAQLNIKDFAYSQGWLDKLKRRSGVKGYITHGEAGSVDSEAAIKGIKNVRTLLGGYQDRDIYNMDETEENEDSAIYEDDVVQSSGALLKNSVENPDYNEENSRNNHKSTEMSDSAQNSEENLKTPSPDCYTCQQCDVPPFPSLLQFIDHMRNAHLNTPGTATTPHCQICGTIFVNEHELIEHLIEHFISTRNIYTCLLCQSCDSAMAAFSSLHLYRQHFVSQHTDILYRCRICLKVFSDSLLYQEHSLEHAHQKPIFSCIRCAISFKSRELFDIHIKLIHYKEGSRNDSPGTSQKENGTLKRKLDNEDALENGSGNTHDPSDYHNNVSTVGVNDSWSSQRIGRIFKIHDGTRRARIMRQRKLNARSFKCMICDAVFTRFESKLLSSITSFSLQHQPSGQTLRNARSEPVYWCQCNK